MGDPAGIGPEVLIEAAARPAVRRACTLTAFGDSGVLERAARCKRIGAGRPTAISEVVEVGSLRSRGGLPRPGRSAGGAAFAYLEEAAAAVKAGRFDGLVTGPVNKAWIARTGRDFHGHTDYLSDVWGGRAVMMLRGRVLRVVLVTVHIGIAEVPAALTAAKITRAAKVTAKHLALYEGLKKPRLAVAALNPHGGEAGMFGDEERRIIGPAVKRLARSGLRVEGPLAADSLFAAAAAGEYDAVICMYHDQGLIALKLTDFGRAVNVSMGLPFVRTSPDHGTAYELAGAGTCDAGSMTEAILLAARMAR